MLGVLVPEEWELKKEMSEPMGRGRPGSGMGGGRELEGAGRGRGWEGGRAGVRVGWGLVGVGRWLRDAMELGGIRWWEGGEGGGYIEE